MLVDQLEPEDRHLFFIDADDVFCEYQMDRVNALVDSGTPAHYLGLAELWGDLEHSTQRLHHHDKCHVYVDRQACPNLSWGMNGSVATLSSLNVKVRASRTPLFFHIKGVKPDWRLAIRASIRKFWHGKRERRAGTIAEWLSITVDEPTPELHIRAMNFLLTSRQDKIRPTYVEGRNEEWIDPTTPVRPQVIVDAPMTFRMVYGGRAAPADRTSKSWVVG